MPVDRLNGSSESPHRKSPPKPPGPSSPTYTSPHFDVLQPRSETNIAVCLPSSSRKRSFDTATVVSEGSQSQRTHRSMSRTANTSNVPELRHVLGYTKASRSRKRQRYDKLLSPNGVESDPIAVDEDDEQDEVQLVPSQDGKTNTKQVAPEKMAKRYRTPISSQLGNRGKLAAQMYDKSPVRTKRSSFITDRGTGSPDPLTHPTDDPKPGSVRRAMGPSETMRGDIPRSKFVSTKRPVSRGQARPQQSLATEEAALDVAKRIVGDGLRVHRAVSGPNRYDGATEPEDQHLTLGLREISSILHARGHDSTDSMRYQWCIINLGKLKRVHISQEEQASQFVYMVRSSDASTNSSALIMLEFVSIEHCNTFVRWVENYHSKFTQAFSVKKVSQEWLARTFENTWEKAEHQPLLPIPTPKCDADDVTLIKHNMAKRAADTSEAIPDKSQKRPKIKDSMSTLTGPVAPVNSTSGDIPIDLPKETPWAKRPIRNTRATFVPISRSPTPPTAPSWTSQNPTWSEKWRNSVVYPPTGKNRAVVDKNDIDRLNEGEFLNDNLIIFYLRYLQHNLENQRKDLAERIYFHNTFFFERLKPTKSGAGINYGNVKGWTNKVDLFSKDFIVVPINEHTHWYVAIICNAPKLIASEPDEKDAKALVVEAQEETERGAAPQSSPERIVSDIAGDGGAELAAKLDQIQMNGLDVEVANADAGVRIDSGLQNSVQRKKTAKRQSTGRKFDPTMPRIITLDSLDSPHSPACGYLKQYLVAEAKDKKKVDVIDPGSLGMTARDIPLQQNHCDCGLYLLGYIKEFLLDPDAFVRSIIQHGHIDWKLDPSALRHEIRGLLFELQAEQRKQEDEAAEERKSRKRESLKGRQQKTDKGQTSSPVHNSPVRPQLTAPPSEPAPKAKAMTVDASLLLHQASGISQDSVEIDESLSDKPLLEESQQSIQEIASVPARILPGPQTTKVQAIVDVAQTFLPLLPESSDESSSPLPPALPSAVEDIKDLQSNPKVLPDCTVEESMPKVDSEEVVLPSVERTSPRPSPELHCDSAFAGKRPGDHRGSARIRQKNELVQPVITLDSDED